MASTKWIKELLKLEFKNLHFSFLFKGCISPPCIQGDPVVVFYLFLSLLRISQDLSSGAGKTRDMFERKCALIIVRKTHIWLISSQKFSLKPFFGDILAVTQGYCVTNYIKLNCNLKNSNLQTVKTVSLAMVINEQ